MTHNRIPVDSADARDLREALEAQEESPPAESHDPRCDGWLGEDPAGRPIPCMTCRPHLAELRARQHKPWRNTA